MKKGKCSPSQPYLFISQKFAVKSEDDDLAQNDEEVNPSLP